MLKHDTDKLSMKIVAFQTDVFFFYFLLQSDWSIKCHGYPGSQLKNLCINKLLNSNLLTDHIFKVSIKVCSDQNLELKPSIFIFFNDEKRITAVFLLLQFFFFNLSTLMLKMIAFFVSCNSCWLQNILTF